MRCGGGSIGGFGGARGRGGGGGREVGAAGGPAGDASVAGAVNVNIFHPGRVRDPSARTWHSDNRSLGHHSLE